ncbi:hypothetical protein IT084_08540 [Desulfallas sp. Bu1-1]|nr:hypothetical protein [Desulfallas sp. Bu1-1]
MTVEKLGSTVKPRAPDTSSAVAPVAPVTPTGSEGKYIGNKNSKKFHLPSCSTLPAEYNRVYFKTREEAVSAGYTPCKRCNP